MKNSKLNDVLKYDGISFEDDMNKTYDMFNDCFMKKENRPMYKQKFIFFNMSRDTHVEKNNKKVILTLSKPERFLHIISLESKFKYKVAPCGNDDSIECCKNDCRLENSLDEFQLLNRCECYYRMSRILRVPKVIELANRGDENIEEWTEVEKDSKGSKVYKNFIRYNHKRDDYIVILKENRRAQEVYQYNFITAFPLFDRDSKEEYNKKYRKSKKEHIKKPVIACEIRRSPSTHGR